jgi:uncharacterized protein (DUF488 family)
VIYGVGYEGRDLDGFLDLLRANEVTVVADVRLNPISRKPGFSKNRLAAALRESGIGYEHLRALGNPKENRPAFQRGGGRDEYRALLDGDDAVAALARIGELARDGRVAVLCFERDEAGCHRALVLERLGLPWEALG